MLLRPLSSVVTVTKHSDKHNNYYYTCDTGTSLATSPAKDQV